MTWPDYPPVLTSAPVRAGIGLRARFLKDRARRPPPEWPPDWWQRNCDLLLEPEGPIPIPLCGRQLTIPPAPGGEVTP